MFFSEIISYPELVAREKANLRKVTNFGIRPGYSFILMPFRRGAAYHDRIDVGRSALIDEGSCIHCPVGIEPKRSQERIRIARLLGAVGAFCSFARRTA